MCQYNDEITKQRIIGGSLFMDIYVSFARTSANGKSHSSFGLSTASNHGSISRDEARRSDDDMSQSLRRDND